MRYCEACRASFQALRTCPRDKLPTRADLADPLLGHVLGQRYRVLERIAAGGMGQVYRAAHTRIATLFAVKVLYGDIAHDTMMRARFQREAEAASCLQSRHIVRVVDFDESPEDLLYIVMEHLDGPTLAAALARERVFTIERALRIGVQIARGLAHAHERGIIHRDLKPGNVMLLAEDDEEDVARLLDFGIARLQHQSSLTEAGAVMGTPQYMAPEQFTGTAIDARADLYALGIILYELLTGEPPFDAGNIVTFMHLHLKEAPAPLRARNASFQGPPELEALVMRLLAKSPDDRFSSARAVVAALKAIDPRGARPSVEPDPRPSRAPETTRAIALPLIGFAAAERIHAAIEFGAPAYNLGDHAACYNCYREAAEGLLREGLRKDTQLAAGARLDIALRRAAVCTSPTLAAWELRYAFDDLLQASSLRPNPSIITTELTAAALIAAPRYAAGDLDLVGDYYVTFASWLLHKLRETQGDANVITALESSLASAQLVGGGQHALAHVGQILDALRQGLRATTPELPSVPSRLVQIFPRASEFGERILQAIALGAPEFNLGHTDACYRIYRDAALGIVADLTEGEGGTEIRTLLEAALASAGRLAPAQGAWVLRHAFDSILAEVQLASERSLADSPPTV